MVANTKDPVLIMIRGLPGSGKSHLAHELQKLIGTDDSVVLDPDMTDYSAQDYISFSTGLTSEGVDSKLHPYRFLRSKGYAGITGRKIIIWNQAFTHLDLLDRTIKNLQAYAGEQGTHLPAIVVEVDIDIATAKARVAKREADGGHGVTDEEYERFINEYKSFSGYGYMIIAVDGAADVAASAQKIMAEIEKLRVT